MMRKRASRATVFEQGDGEFVEKSRVGSLSPGTVPSASRINYFQDEGTGSSFIADAGSDEIPKLETFDAEIPVAFAVVLCQVDQTLSSVVPGVLTVTNYRTAFRGTESKEWNFDVPHSLVFGAYILVAYNNRKPLTMKSMQKEINKLEIECKNFNRYIINFGSTSEPERKKIATSIYHWIQISSIEKLFAFELSVWNESHAKFPQNLAVERRTCLEKELQRCGIREDSRWYTTQNLGYRICPTYPKLFVVPSKVSDVNVVRSASSWAGNRLPVWCWSKRGGSSWLVRASHPLSKADDLFQSALGEEYGIQTIITLARPKDGSTFTEVNQSFLKLASLVDTDPYKLSESVDTNWNSHWQSTKWPYQIQRMLHFACQGAKAIKKEHNVLILGDQEGDFDCITSSLIQILVDPYFRTTTGFQVLLQKEWLAMGFPFATRCGFVHHQGLAMKPSGVYYLFLDCVNQLMFQFPSSFEFTNAYLADLWTNILSSYYGTFLFNCDKERENCSEFEHMTSLWSQDVEVGDKFLNLLYTESDEVLLPKALLHCLHPWASTLFPQSKMDIPSIAFTKFFKDMLARKKFLERRKLSLLEKTPRAPQVRPSVSLNREEELDDFFTDI
eukprot:m.281426 g.281426  ORF g.281426 m.281426 type:complete len:615 (-) comp16332_c0_seq4:57-1901(-)